MPFFAVHLFTERSVAYIFTFLYMGFFGVLEACRAYHAVLGNTVQVKLASLRYILGGDHIALGFYVCSCCIPLRFLLYASLRSSVRAPTNHANAPRAFLPFAEAMVDTRSQ